MRKPIIAKEGCILTNGEIYGTVIYLEDERTKADFEEISREEYEKIMEEKRKNDKNSLHISE